MACGLCRKNGHDRRKCPNKINIERLNLLKKYFKALSIFCKSLTKNIAGRRYDSEYWIYKDLVSTYEAEHNVPFTEKDRTMKYKIFDITCCKMCFITKKLSKSEGGDHIYEIRGYKKYTGFYGGNSEWNTIPVIGSLNKTYKVIKHNGWKKYIGYQELSKQELSECTEQEKIIYNKIYEWRKYCKKRRARWCWMVPKKVEDSITKDLDATYNSYSKKMRQWTSTPPEPTFQ